MAGNRLEGPDYAAWSFTDESFELAREIEGKIVSIKERRRPKRRFKINFPLDDNCCVGEQTNDDDAVARRGNDGGEARKTGVGGLAGRIGQP